MIRCFAKRRAKREYVQKLELEAATHDINAQLAMNRAKEKRAYIGQLNKEADDVEANIAKEEAADEYKALTGQEEYEARAGKERCKEDCQPEAPACGRGSRTTPTRRSRISGELGGADVK